MTLKQDTRASVLARRKQIPSALREEKSLSICERFLEEIDSRFEGETPSSASAERLRIAAYEPMTSEVDVHPLLYAAYEHGWEVYLPCMAKDTRDTPAHMVFFPITQNHLTEQRPAFLDHPARPYLLDELHAQGWQEADERLFNVAVIPLVAFDSGLMRLGYGGGNYDRFLPKLREDCLVAGVAFEEQRIDRVPTEPHDLPLPCIFSA
ncbi:5-formyltetrahydrofolate cyclo-ligase [uncultured Senegalimassilia sp.]|uniref:5-formyltetrahydrofolate cyclo-ligase n=1 Tax=uncultured Senegalimassilia sp. TaxID=1714350 RepID=UPI0025F9B210|nr:5-formyltetrahydrofolate cyclo-ligase [uncultured Senegalimassilia sp.]